MIVGTVGRSDVGDENVLKKFGSLRQFQDECGPHHLRNVATTKKVMTVTVLLQCDGASLSTSKKSNSHNSWLMTLGSLPFKIQQQDPSVFFLCTSKHALSLEMARPLVDSITSKLEKGIEFFDTSINQTAIAYGTVLCLLGDNPMQNAMASVMSMKARRFCRMCKVEFKEFSYCAANTIPYFKASHYC